MRKLSVFNFTTLNGFFEGPGHDISWHRADKEHSEYAAEGVNGGSILLFGRVTYELMVSYWTSEMAIKNDPIVAEGMNSAEKIVFSRTLAKADWNNTTLIKENIVEEIRKLKQTPGKDLTILGSGTIVTQFADQGLIDIYQLMINPIALGNGSTLFKGLTHPLELKLTSTRTFRSGNMLLCYEPA